MTEQYIPQPSVENMVLNKNELQKTWDEYIDTHEKSIATVIEITNYCPNNCAHCYANLSIGKNTTEMSLETFNNCLDILSSNKEKKPDQIWLVGGEPTKHPLLKNFLQKTKERGFQAMIVTTGESFEDIDFCRQIIPETDEIDISIRGMGIIHNLMMCPNGNQLLLSVPRTLPVSEQIAYAVKKIEEGSTLENHFDKTIKGLVNIAKVKEETNSPTIIGLNVDIQAMTDLYQIIKTLNDKKVPVENIILQVQTFSEHNQYLANILPNLWRKPTVDMIETYYRQAKFLTDTEMYQGGLEIIDELPSEILQGLKARNINLGQFYNPAATPAISPKGELRPNVITETKN